MGRDPARWPSPALPALDAASPSQARGPHLTSAKQVAPDGLVGTGQGSGHPAEMGQGPLPAIALTPQATPGTAGARWWENCFFHRDLKRPRNGTQDANQAVGGAGSWLLFPAVPQFPQGQEGSTSLARRLKASPITGTRTSVSL